PRLGRRPPALADPGSPRQPSRAARSRRHDLRKPTWRSSRLALSARSAAGGAVEQGASGGRRGPIWQARLVPERLYPMTHGRRAAVLALLRRVSRSEPVVVAEQELGGWWAPVTRLVFERDLPDVGPWVIVKTRRDGVVGWGDAEHFAGEQAALTLLGSSGLGPRLIAADDDEGVMLLGDLGELPTVESILLGRDRDRAIDALCGL